MASQDGEHDAGGADFDSLAYDAAVAVSIDVDPYCSSTDWIVPAHTVLTPGSPVVAQLRDTWVAVQLLANPGGRVLLASFEAAWGFACPAVGPDPSEAAGLLGDVLEGEPTWDLAVLAGFVPNTPRWERVAEDLTRRFAAVFAGEELVRQVADLSRGVDGWWGLRSTKFRASIRRARRMADERHVRMVVHDAADDELWRAIETVEGQSWKGQAGGGLTSDNFVAFYRAVAQRVAPTGRWRARVAYDGDDPIGFIFGAVRGRRYRGMQLSYAQDWASLSVGNLLQMDEIDRLAREGIDTYDLGMDMDYKRRWADTQLVTRPLIVVRDASQLRP